MVGWLTGKAIVGMVHLMYQNTTAGRFLRSLMGVLLAECHRRRLRIAFPTASCSWCCDTADVEIQIENGCQYCARCGRRLRT